MLCTHAQATERLQYIVQEQTVEDGGSLGAIHCFSDPRFLLFSVRVLGAATSLDGTTSLFFWGG
eukprot:3624008-Pleurochrysis_carterae.AAC.1